MKQTKVSSIGRALAGSGPIGLPVELPEASSHLQVVGRSEARKREADRKPLGERLGVRFLHLGFRWAQELGRPECPYVRRWVLDLGLFSIRLHHWMSSDDPRHLHDHPWWYVSLILRGSYVDVCEDSHVRLSAGDVIFRRAEHRHSVKVSPVGCWSLLLTGRERRTWGFWVNGKFRKRNKYFFEHGHHPCESRP